MSEILIFGGTTEGRFLTEFCENSGIEVWVSVVSDYGKDLLSESSRIHVTKRAMDRDEMAAFMREKKIRLAVDATHPYAREVSENIRAACAMENVELIRCLREDGERPDNVFWVSDAEEAADFLQKKEGKILVTTGSRELDKFCVLPDFRERVYVRVLPSSEVLARCEKLGIPGSHIYAAQGPFSEAANRILLEETGASWLVTKNSGQAGGFREKLLAADSAGVSVVVICRPSEDGIEWRKVCHYLEKYAACRETDPGKAEKTEKWPLEGSSDAQEEKPGNGKGYLSDIILAGIGMGNPKIMTREVQDAICSGDIIFGARRMLESAECVLDGRNTFGKPQMIETYLPDEIVQKLGELKGNGIRAVVLYSGDTGFYSGFGGLSRRLREQKIPFRVMPGISGISYFSARLGVSWQDAAVYSAHGRNLNAEEIREEKKKKIFILAGGKNGVCKLCRALVSVGLGDSMISVGERLSYPDERIRTGRVREFTGGNFSDLSLVLIEKEE